MDQANTQKRPFDQQLHDFQSWFTSSGGRIHPSAEIAHSASAGVHLRARCAIPRGTCVISVPHNITFSALNALDVAPSFPCHGHNFPNNGEDNTVRARIRLPDAILREAPRAQCVAAVWLCVQIALGEGSWWSPYLACLPCLPSESMPGNDGAHERPDPAIGEVDTPMWWSGEERGMVRGTPLEKGYQDLESFWGQEWAGWVEPVVLPFASEVGFDIDWPLYKWAMTILNSRAFSSAQISKVIIAKAAHERNATHDLILNHYDPDVLLYPLFDFLNHSARTQNSWLHDENCFSLTCNDEPKKGHEIWNTYGCKDNGQLLLSYGFALPSSPHDAFPIKLPPTQATPFLETLRSTAGTISLEVIDPKPRESTLPPSHDVVNGIFYVRHPELPGLAELGYPDPIVHPHFSAFPIALLTRLCLMIANKREKTHLEGPIGSKERSLTDLNHINNNETQTAEAPSTLLTQRLGPRNSLALASLLRNRLHVEIFRLRPPEQSEERRKPSLKRKASPTDTAAFNTNVNVHQARHQAHQQRRRYAQIYRSGLLHILTPAMARLESHIRPSIITAENDLDKQGKHLLPLHVALHVLSACFPAPNRLTDTVTSISHAAADSNEETQEDAWTLWLLCLTTSVPPRPQPHREITLPPRLREWLNCMNQHYHPRSESATTVQHEDQGEQEDEETAQLIQHTLGLAAKYHMHDLQPSVETAKFAVSVVREETLDVDVAAADGCNGKSVFLVV